MASRHVAHVNAVTIDYAAGRLARFARKHQIKAELENILEEKIDSKDFELILRAARQQINEESSRDKQQLLADSTAMLQRIISESQDDKIVMAAAQQLADLIGIGAKWTGDSEGPQSKAAKIRELMSAVDAAMASDESESEAEEVLEE